MKSNELISTRIVLEKSFAFLPTAEIHESLIPNLRDTTIKVLASPQLGANFVEYLLMSERKGGSIEPFKEDGIEHFLFVLEGEGEIETEKDELVISKGDYAYVPPGSPLSFQASEKGLKIILLKKRYESFSSETPGFIFSNERDVEEDFEDGYSWQYLIPFELKYDMRMDIGNFPSGVGFDYVETHFEEHGMYILSGRGLYYLGDRWYPYEEGDFVWMAPFCPQSVYPVGSEKTRYLIYKNWYRDIRL